MKSRKAPPRRSGTREAFERKVQILEAWVRDGAVPASERIPDGPVALARWQNDRLGLTPWVSPNVAAPRGQHAELRRRFDIAVQRLRELAPRKKRPGEAQLIAELRTEKRRNVALAEQVVRLQDDKIQLAEALARSQQLNADAKIRERELLEKLATVVPLRSVRK